MCVTLSTADDFEELTELWEASVRATHHFIPEQYILKLKPLVWSVYLRSMPVYTVRGPERIEGFMGINGDMLEMLFVHPQAMGKGVGKKLLKYAINSCRVRYVDVNEQNEQAYGFYRHLGFKVIGRDATDASGEPYPILHLKLKENMKIENWGTVPYSEAWERQTVLFNALVEAKQEGKPYENRIIFVEHPHVYTLGKSGKDANMLLGEAQLQAIGATLYHIDRGGRYYLSWSRTTGLLPYFESGRLSFGFKRIHSCIGGSGDSGLCFVWYRSRQSKRSDRRMACHRNSPGTEDLCYGGAQQSFRYDAWTGIECQYGLALFWVYQSMRIYK